jgi:GH25 family lysozyme M1 (1,4-beta-N-acetylmuramidase)
MKHRLLAALSNIFLLALAACGPATEEATPDPSLEDGQAVEAIKASPPYHGDPANGAVFAVDISHWEGPMSQAEMDCFWESGVRHVVSGTQVEEVTRQQLDMALRRGMTVDAYVYLYWTDDMVGQVEKAFARVSGFPIGRMWLDVEQEPQGIGANDLAKRVQSAVDACQAKGTAQCGIYTGQGFWKGAMANMTKFAELPLWYAHYNFKKELSHWPGESFGGWAAPVAKQWAEQVLCSVGVDKDTMQVVSGPPLVVDRTLPPPPTTPPPAPPELYPANGAKIQLDYVKLMAGLVPHATSYQLALESWDGKVFKPYYTWTRPDGFQKVTPKLTNQRYRFRARANNAHGWGPWSPFTVFDHGKPTTSPPPAPPPTTPPPETPPPEPPPETPPPPTGGGGFGALSPNGTTLSSAAVTLTCSALAGATQYEFVIESAKGQSYVPYMKYSATQPSRTFYPQLHGTTYRWRVRALLNGSWTEPSIDATFQYQ